MTRQAQITIWDAINEYARACGGDTSNRTLTAWRMSAVVLVERIIDNEIYYEARNKAMSKPELRIKRKVRLR